MYVLYRSVKFRKHLQIVSLKSQFITKLCPILFVKKHLAASKPFWHHVHYFHSTNWNYRQLLDNLLLLWNRGYNSLASTLFAVCYYYQKLYSSGYTKLCRRYNPFELIYELVVSLSVIYRVLISLICSHTIHNAYIGENVDLEGLSLYNLNTRKSLVQCNIYYSNMYYIIYSSCRPKEV